MAVGFAKKIQDSAGCRVLKKAAFYGAIANCAENCKVISARIPTVRALLELCIFVQIISEGTRMVELPL